MVILARFTIPEIKLDIPEEEESEGGQPLL